MIASVHHLFLDRRLHQRIPSFTVLSPSRGLVVQSRLGLDISQTRSDTVSYGYSSSFLAGCDGGQQCVQTLPVKSKQQTNKQADDDDPVYAI